MRNRFRGLSKARKADVMALAEMIYNEGFEAAKKEFGGLDTGVVIFDETHKSPNQQRAELIQRAREFVEVKSAFKRHLSSGEKHTTLWEADFVVNADKTTVVCLLKGKRTKHVYGKGIAKCHPDEVFNESIGKAIALARALEIDVPQEFLKAVQPTEVVVGHIITFPKTDSWHMKHNYRVDKAGHSGEMTVIYNEISGLDHRIGGKASSNFNRDESFITDDTNAQYGEESH